MSQDNIWLAETTLIMVGNDCISMKCMCMCVCMLKERIREWTFCSQVQNDPKENILKFKSAVFLPLKAAVFPQSIILYRMLHRVRGTLLWVQ